MDLIDRFSARGSRSWPAARLTIGLILVSSGLLSAPAAARAPSMVRVPAVQGTPVATAYRTVHARQLGVTIDRPFQIEYGLAGPPLVVKSAPAAGRLVSRGSSVSLTTACGCAVFSPGVPNKLPRYRMPSFVGRPAGAVFGWLSGRLMAATLHFGRLSHGLAASLYANYTVDRQVPAPGSMVSFGRAQGSGTFVPTPIRVWLGQPTATGAGSVKHETQVLPAHGSTEAPSTGPGVPLLAAIGVAVLGTVLLAKKRLVARRSASSLPGR